METKVGLKIAFWVVSIATIAVSAENGAVIGKTNRVATAEQKVAVKPFDIPPSLIFRMEAAHYAALRGERGITNAFDALELFALGKAGFTNAYEISVRPRGEMKFCDDQLTEEERKSLWPFEVEAFEKSLEQKLVRDKGGRYRLVRKYLSEVAMTNDVFSPVPTLKAAHLELRGDDELEASNPTIRWVNHQIEQWAIKQMDSKFKRMDGKSFCKMSGDEKMPEDTFAWELDKMGEDGTGRECFVIQRGEGAWNPREYMYILWDGKDRVVPVASFASFPNRKEAAALRMYICDIAALHNLAVLEWRHRVDSRAMSPLRIKLFLEKSKRLEVPTAEGNLKVLFDHIPEARLLK